MRRLALFCGGFAAGIFLAQYLLPGGWLLSGGLVCLALGFGALLLPECWRKRAILCLVGAALALGWNWLYVRQVSEPMEALADSQRALTMTLTEYPTETRFGAKVTVRAEGLPGKLTYYGDPTLLQLSPGQCLTDEVYLQSASRIRDDDVTVFNSKGVFLLAYSRGTVAFHAGTVDAPRWWPARLGRAMQARIRDLFSGDDAGFLLALLTGRKGELSTQADVDLSEAGVYHILAVSGMHCAYLLAMVGFLAGKHRRRLTAAAAIPTLIFYAVLTGGSPSVVRACVMLSSLTAAPLFRRESDPPTALMTALFLILLDNPFAAKSVSLQLSFGAVVGLLWLSPKLYRGLAGEKKHGRLFTFTTVSISTTFGCLALTAPISAYYFGSFAPVSLLSNLLCLWAVGIVFIGGLAAVLLSFFYLPLGTVIGLVPRLLIKYILAVCHALAALPCHGVYFCNPYLKYWMGFVYLLFAAAWLLKPKGRRKFAVAAALSVLTLAVTVRAGESRFCHRLNAAAVDVGQGQSVILRSGTETALVDCGAALDRLLELAERYGMDVETVTEETHLPFGNGELTIFPPLGVSGSNELGLTVLASAGEHDFLITGDMERATEKKLIETYELPEMDVLMAGHHGSKDSTSKELLDAVTPGTVIISVGSNSYGHPAEDTLRRLARAGCDIYRTDRHGTVYLSFD